MVNCIIENDGVVRKCEGWREDRLDRNAHETRSPWHDIGCVVQGIFRIYKSRPKYDLNVVKNFEINLSILKTFLTGTAAHDVGRHFIERWNATIYHCFKAAVKLKLPGLRRFRLPNFGADDMLKQVIVPRRFSDITENFNQRRDSKISIKILILKYLI